jgi:glycogen debranching enzyme
MARTLLKADLTAGQAYREVWIRDLNTFIDVALEVNDRAKLRDALLTILAFQGEDGNVPDGYTPAGQTNGYYAYQPSPLTSQFVAHKNTIETDQESSVVQAVAKYVRATRDRSILERAVGGESVLHRLERALAFVRTFRLDAETGLVWGGTTVDWGDLEPERAGGTTLGPESHRAIDIYDNAMYVLAIGDYLELAGSSDPSAAGWRAMKEALAKNVRAVLWDAGRQQFVAHRYLAGSPFPASFDERDVFVHGGTAVAIDAGLLTDAETQASLAHMRADVRAAGAGSIGMTVYPPYPAGIFQAPGMEPFLYQNGGDWCWFGGRMVQALLARGFVADAYQELLPMVVRVERAGDFAEWWTRDNEPRGSGQFRGSAGVLGKAIEDLQAWAASAVPVDPHGR